MGLFKWFLKILNNDSQSMLPMDSLIHGEQDGHLPHCICEMFSVIRGIIKVSASMTIQKLFPTPFSGSPCYLQAPIQSYPHHFEGISIQNASRDLQKLSHAVLKLPMIILKLAMVFMGAILKISIAFLGSLVLAG